MLQGALTIEINCGLELALPPLALAFGLGMGEPANGALACCELGSRQPLPSLAFGHRLSLSASSRVIVLVSNKLKSL